MTRTPAQLLGRSDLGRLTEGAPADMVLLRARNWSELLSRPHGLKAVLRHGRTIDMTLPDYRELDPLMTNAVTLERGAAE
ncbi:hypothetical protein V6L77_08755 [Pannonibacter sp. Pt2-lr]